jgi:hypothetical protein
MPDPLNTLGAFIADLMRKHQHSNVSLAAEAGVSEGVIRNLLKYGIDKKAKDPDPRTLRRVADAFGVDAAMFFRLAGYIPPQANANSIRAEYLADVFDELPREKQDAVLGVLEAMSTSSIHKDTVHAMRETPLDPLAGFDTSFPNITRLLANQLIVDYQMVSPQETIRIEPDKTVHGYRWKDLPLVVQQRVKALIEHKLSLDFQPTMVDPEWRG